MSEVQGCAICKDFRAEYQLFERNLIWPDDEDIESVPLRRANQQSVRILKRMMTQLENDMTGKVHTCFKCKAPQSWKENKFSPVYAKEMSQLSRALKDTLMEGRALEREARGRAENLSQDERIKLAVKFYTDLPVEARRKMRDLIIKVKNGMAA